MLKWSYLWAALGLYLFSQIGRIFVKSTLRQAPPAVAELLSDDMIRLSVFVPRKYTWAPGQHCFVRIAAVSNFESHPFTIASTPLTSSTTRSFNTLTFLIRRHSGFTKRFHACLTQNTWSGNVHLEGPYGGMGWKPENRYGTIILVAGGNGITTCLSWLLYLSKRIRDDPVTLRHIYVIWLVRHRSQLMWAEREFQEARTIAPREALTFDLYITGAASQASSVHDADNIELTEINELRERERELRLEAGDNTSIRHCERGRPNIGNAIEKAPRAACTFVIGCGPESLKIDLSNAVASMQKRVLRNECAEIGLHTETYDW
ncbi:MAG: hypothetical protein M1814_006270 [Vezdaea aestivalis]|nr:MAG: hypothetical protein M1814_006270 [Vezdaea aestivalis]